MKHEDINDIMYNLEKVVNETIEKLHEHEQEVFANEAEGESNYTETKWWKAHTAYELARGITYTKLAIRELLESSIAE